MKFIILVVLITIKLQTNAQQVFIQKGKIEFEKQINLHKNIEEMWDKEEDENFVENYKKMLPKTQTIYFDLYFNEEKTLYKVGKESPQTNLKVPEWMENRSNDNIIYNNLLNNQIIAQKNIFETQYLITDSLRKIDWKITNDTRTIAGIECRKAIAKVMDSVYIIAFYTDIIICSGGPESFTGLPGMILGVAIPRLNTTWFATKVQLIDITDANFTIPTKGKKTNFKNLATQVRKSTKDWGKNAEKNVWEMLL